MGIYWKMIDEEVMFIFGVVVIVVALVLFVGLLCWYDSNCVYKNVTSIINNKWEDEYTTTVVYSNGKCAWAMPQYHHDYLLNTSYGELNVGSDIYNQYDVNDSIDLTMNLNTSKVHIRSVFYGN